MQDLISINSFLPFTGANDWMLINAVPVVVQTETGVLKSVRSKPTCELQKLKKCKAVITYFGSFNRTILCVFSLSPRQRPKLHWLNELKSLKKCEVIISPVKVELFKDLSGITRSVLDVGRQAWMFSCSFVSAVVTLTSQGRAKRSRFCVCLILKETLFEDSVM